MKNSSNKNKSYGVRSGKRIYEGYNDERKVVNMI